MTTSATTAGDGSNVAPSEQSRREKLARMAERFDEVDRRLAELEARLERVAEEFRPKQPR